MEENKERDFRIRKLTPRECFRLMDVSEENIDKIQASGISNSQQYKMAGNSIVVGCLVEVFRQMFRPVYIAGESVIEKVKPKKPEPVPTDEKSHTPQQLSFLDMFS